jgi:hypothetical protein
MPSEPCPLSWRSGEDANGDQQRENPEESDKPVMSIAHVVANSRSGLEHISLVSVLRAMEKWRRPLPFNHNLFGYHASPCVKRRRRVVVARGPSLVSLYPYYSYNYATINLPSYSSDSSGEFSFWPDCPRPRREYPFECVAHTTTPTHFLPAHLVTCTLHNQMGLPIQTK